MEKPAHQKSNPESFLEEFRKQFPEYVKRNPDFEFIGVIAYQTALVDAYKEVSGLIHKPRGAA